MFRNWNLIVAVFDVEYVVVVVAVVVSVVDYDVIDSNDWQCYFSQFSDYPAVIPVQI